MASFVKFQVFPYDLATKLHNLNSDVLKICLTNTAPNTASNLTLGNITQITAQNGYTSGGITAAFVSGTTASGTYKLVVGPTTFTASGGSFGPFEYAVFYNDTATNKNLIGYWDYGASITVTSGNSVVVQTDQSGGVLTIT